jgi:PAS domain S-box-containing protein
MSAVPDNALKDGRLLPPNPWAALPASGVTLVGLYLLSRANYLLFHAAVELFSIVVASGVFMIAWNSRRFQNNGFFLCLGIGSVFVAGVDFLHALAYKNMGVFPGRGTNLPTQLWIVARYLHAASLLFSLFLLRRRPRSATLFASYLAVTTLLLAAVFGGIFPDCLREGTGLTPFKIGSEYLICLFLAGSWLLLRRRRQIFDPDVLRLISLALAAFILAELAFTLYTDVFGLSNMAGHLFKVAGFYLLYRAVIETGLTRPYDLLFRELKQSEERYRSLYEKTPVMLHSIDREGRLLSVSDYWLEHLGYRREEVLGLPFTGFLTDESRRRAAETVLPEFFRSGEVKEVPYRVLKQNGEAIEVLLSAVAERNGEGEITRSLAVMVDVTGIMRAQAELAHFASFPQLNPNPVLEINSDGTVAFCNRASTETLRKIGLSDNATQFLPEGMSEVYRALAGQQDVVLSREVAVGDRIFAESVQVLPQYAVIRIYATDITARKRAEEDLQQRGADLEAANVELEATIDELARTNRELETANEALEAFNYSVSHDLRGPLTVISGQCQVLLHIHAGKVDPEVRQFIQGIYEETWRMNDLISTMLQFSRLGKVALDRRQVDLSAMARRIALQLAAREPRRRAAFTIAEGMAVEGDAGLLQISLENLLGNAWKYSGKAAEAHIEFGTIEIEGGRVFFVRDNGTGFDMAHAADLFTPFKRLHGGGEYEGHGIGLATVQRIVDRHGGRIWAESAPEQGATFYFTI